MALHRLGPVLFSTNVVDQINFFKSKNSARLSFLLGLHGVEKPANLW